MGENRPLRAVHDARGQLVFGQFPDHLPFPPVRFFAITGVPEGTVRGEHAHRTCELFLVMLTGQCTVDMWDRERVHSRVRLVSGRDGVYVPAGVFSRQYGFTPDAVLLVLASHVYDPQDYIHEQEFFDAGPR